ncbi:MAG: SurA N-terminal domain-containing protein [Gammaproteobacteria bacterium]
MFESIRKHQRVLQFILLLLIFPAFAFFGVSGYDRFLGEDDSVASVAGSGISRAEYDDAMRRQVEQLRATLGEQLDPKMFDTPEVRAEILEGLIAQRALLADAVEKRITVGDARLREAIRGIPGLVQADGSFDIERYRSVLRAQGMNEAAFEAEMRRDLAVQAMPEAAARTALVPASVLDRLIALQEQVREVRELRFRPQDFAGKVSPTPEQLRKHYEENAQAFETPESAKVAYLVLSARDVEAQVKLGADDVRTYYDQNKARYGVPEQRRASHILLQADAGAGEEARKAARARAEDLLRQARAGADFAALAREHSQDPGSAREGGDLGFFGREMMVKPFADAAFALSEGALSEVVESEFGFHVIKLTGIRPGAVKPFEEVRAEIESDLRRQQAGRLFAEAAEGFTNMVYEQADSLEPAASRYGLKVRTVESLTRAGVVDEGKGGSVEETRLLANPKLLAALFSADSVSRKQNTEAVDVGASTLVSARILEHRPARRKPFETVEAEVRARVVAAESRTLAAAAAKARLEELRAGAQAAGFGPPTKVSRAAPGDLPPAALDPVFRAATDKLPAYAIAELGAEGHAVYQIAAVTDASEALLAQRRAAYGQQIEQMVGQQDVADYIASVKARSKVERHPERLGGGAAER